MEKPAIQPVILSGGSGTRVWPFSRPEKPKQLLPLTGERSMLQLTAARVQDRTRFRAPIVVCGASHSEGVASQLLESELAPEQLIVEPLGRNTAPAIALAAASVAPDTPLLVMPSDHIIVDLAPFFRAVDLAMAVAKDGWIVTFGVCPDRPETGFGYIRPGERLDEGVLQISEFAEKPTHEKACEYLSEGDCLWNSGIFLFRAGDYLDALSRHAPSIREGTRIAVDRARRDGARMYPDEAALAEVPSVSIDCAVLEKTDRAAVVPIGMDWSDLGSWDAVYDIRDKDESGNAISGDVLTFDTEGSLIISDGANVTAIGVKDLMILVSGDSVLVLPRGEGQRVREIADARKRGG